MKSLDDLIQSVSRMGEEDRQPPPPADLLFYAPCPVKLAVKDAIDALADALAAAHAATSAGDGNPLAIHIPMGCTSVDPYDPLHRETDPDLLPQVIASIGFGDFFRRGFVERFVNAGCSPHRNSRASRPCTARRASWTRTGATWSTG